MLMNLKKICRGQSTPHFDRIRSQVNWSRLIDDDELGAILDELNKVFAA